MHNIGDQWKVTVLFQHENFSTGEASGISKIIVWHLAVATLERIGTNISPFGDRYYRKVWYIRPPTHIRRVHLLDFVAKGKIFYKT
jgi:hypothetical protein